MMKLTLDEKQLAIIHEAVEALAEVTRYQAGLAQPNSEEREALFLKAKTADRVLNQIEKL